MEVKGKGGLGIGTYRMNSNLSPYEYTTLIWRLHEQKACDFAIKIILDDTSSSDYIYSNLQ